MKAEDIERLYYRYTQFRDAPTVPWSELSQHAKEAFASVCRACEQHGIERALTGVTSSISHMLFYRHIDDQGSPERTLAACAQALNAARAAIEQLERVLDAEIAKENEGSP